MKNFRFLMVGILCLMAMTVATVSTKADLKSVSGPPVPLCDVTCLSITIRQAFDDDGTIRATVQWYTDKVAEVKIVLVAAPVYYNGEFDPTTVIGDEKFVASRTVTDSFGEDPVAGPRTMYPNLDPGYTFIGWDLRAYLVRVCDNTIMGWSNTYVIAWS